MQVNRGTPRSAQPKPKGERTVGWIILTIFALLIIIPSIGYALYSKKVWPARLEAWQAEGSPPSRRPVNYSLIGWGVGGSVLVLWVLISGLMMFKTVGEREVAIVYNFSGTISGKRDKGFVTIAPWQHMEKENIGIQHEEWNFGQDNSAVSLDQQKVFANLAVNYQIDGEKVRRPLLAASAQPGSRSSSTPACRRCSRRSPRPSRRRRSPRSVSSCGSSTRGEALRLSWPPTTSRSSTCSSRTSASRRSTPTRSRRSRSRCRTRSGRRLGSEQVKAEARSEVRGGRW